MTSNDGRDQPTTLTQILTQVAAGSLSVAEAEMLIRRGPPRPRRRSPLLIVGLIFLVIGSVLAAIGMGVGQSNWSFASSADEAEGTVVRMVASGNRGSSPVVRYEVDGRSYEFQSSVSSSPPSYAVGDKVKVLYHADEPHKGTIRSFMDQWLVATIFTGIGSLFALIGLALCLPGLQPGGEWSRHDRRCSSRADTCVTCRLRRQRVRAEITVGFRRLFVRGVGFLRHAVDAIARTVMQFMAKAPRRRPGPTLPTAATRPAR